MMVVVVVVELEGGKGNRYIVYGKGGNLGVGIAQKKKKTVLGEFE